MENNYTPVVNLLIAMKAKKVITAESLEKCMLHVRVALEREKQIIEEARKDSAESILKGEHWDENWYFNKFQNPIII